MKLKLTNLFVDDQDEALRFYVEVLDFVKKRVFPVGRFKWPTVVSPAEPEGTELLLEPSDKPAAKAFLIALFEQGIPAATFAVDDIHQGYNRLMELGAQFRIAPTEAESATIAVFDDTCGNLTRICHS